MLKTGIIGGAGYTAGELIRLLIHHPRVALQWVHSKSQGGKPVSIIHRDLVGETDLRFRDSFSWKDLDVVFLCVGHGQAAVFLAENPVPPSVKVIDLSQDYRLGAKDGFVYGLPELNRSLIQESNRIANPGCFATAIQLALLPLAHQQALKQEVHIHAITGSTGAGQSPKPTTHFSWRSANVSVYKAFEHQHLNEIRQSLGQLQANYESAINFVPLRGNFSRGILASVYTKTPYEEEELKEIYQKYYESHPFTHLTEESPDIKQVVNTNKALLQVKVHEGKAHIISVIDNLLKGASGQATQNMNLLFDFPEKMGLELKASYF